MPIYRGCVYEKAIQFKDRSTGQPVNITTWEFEAIWKDGQGATALEMSTGEGHFSVSDGENGWVTLAINGTDSEAMAAGPVTAGLYRTDGGERRRIGVMTEQVREQD